MGQLTQFVHKFDLHLIVCIIGFANHKLDKVPSSCLYSGSFVWKNMTIRTMKMRMGDILSTVGAIG